MTSDRERVGAMIDLPTLDAAFAAIAPQVVAWRRHLHQHPEVAFEEVETSRFIENALSAVDGLTIRRLTPTSIVADLQGALPGPCIAVRADIDALPIHEETDLAYRSTIDGAMHACGHDGHTAIVMALATVLAGYRSHLAGHVRFIFQHAEELAPGGAEALVEAGVMDGVAHVIGLHLWASMPVGRIGLIAGPMMAAPDTFECRIIGRGGHAAIPQDCIDPIAIGAQVVSTWQQVVARTVDPLDPAVLSVTQFHAGTAFNVIPNEAYLAGTVRSFAPELRTAIADQMERIVAGLTSAFGASYHFRYEKGYRPVMNDPTLTARLRQVVDHTFGSETLLDLRPTMGGEDFSAYQQKAPGVFAFVGAGNVEAGIHYPHHHPRFQIDERALAIGLRYLGAATLDLLLDT